MKRKKKQFACLPKLNPAEYSIYTTENKCAISVHCHKVEFIVKTN